MGSPSSVSYTHLHLPNWKSDPPPLAFGLKLQLSVFSLQPLCVSALLLKTIFLDSPLYKYTPSIISFYCVPLRRLTTHQLAPFRLRLCVDPFLFWDCFFWWFCFLRHLSHSTSYRMYLYRFHATCWFQHIRLLHCGVRLPNCVDVYKRQVQGHELRRIHFNCAAAF